MIRQLLSGMMARTGILFASRILGAAAMFLVNIIIARHFGAHALAVFAVCVSATSLLTVVQHFGFPSVAGFFAAEYHARDRAGLLNGFMRYGLRHIMGGSLVAFAVGYAAFLLVPDLRIQSYGLLAMLVWGTALGFSMMDLTGAIAMGLKHQIAGLLPEILVRPVLVLMGLSALVLFVPNVAIWEIMLMVTVATWLATLAGLAMQRPAFVKFFDSNLEYEQPRWRRAAYPWMATTLLWEFLIDIVLLVASLVAQSTEIALLHICFRFRMLADFGVRSIYMMLLPEIASAKALGDAFEMRRRLLQANLAATAYGSLVVLAFAICGSLLLDLFGNNMAEGHRVLIIVVSTIVIQGFFGPTPSVLAIHDRHVASAIIMAIGLAVAVGLVLALYPLFHLAGVAIAFVCAVAFSNVALWLYARERIGVDCSLLAGITYGWRRPKAMGA